MKKKQYSIPSIEVNEFRTDLLKITGPASVLPGAGAQAPKHNTEVF